VRVQIYGKLTDTARALLLKKLRLAENRAFNVTVPFDLSFRSCIGGREGFKYEDRKPVRSIGLNKGEYFDYIEKHDLLLSFPFQSMLPFVDLIYEAADDPDVLSIKITLYRLSSSSKVAAALAYAADKGKDVLCLLELRARFDEQNNIDYSEMLEDAGCTVIYGLPNHKVHSKLCVITRQRDGNITHITQVGTGNYNEVTSEQYTDLSLITADEGAAEDAEAAFTALCRDQFPPEAHTLWIAPNSFKTRVMEMLDREKAKGSKGRVAIKINAINNRDVMEKLIECSQAGVKIELFVRGICCLRPGIPGMTENITIKSVVGRWLEHSRIYNFGEGADQRMFIGSGDLLSRNLERRVEAFMEAVTPDTKAQLNAIIDAMRKDKEKSRTMKPDGTYYREQGGEGTSSQEALYRYFSKINVVDLHKTEDKPEPKPAPQSPKIETPKAAEPKKEATAAEKPKTAEPKKEAPKPAPTEVKPVQPAPKPAQPTAKPTARTQTAAKPVPRPAPVRTSTKNGLFGWLLGRR
jgi:polyphosphate kinase